MAFSYLKMSNNINMPLNNPTNMIFLKKLLITICRISMVFGLGSGNCHGMMTNELDFA